MYNCVSRTVLGSSVGVLLRVIIGHITGWTRFGGGRVSELVIDVYEYKGSKILGSSVGVFLGVSIGDIKGW